jgi:hypothetical protein
MRNNAGEEEKEHETTNRIRRSRMRMKLYRLLLAKTEDAIATT